MRNKHTDIYAYAKQMAEHWMSKNRHADYDDVWDTYNMEDINPLNRQDVNLYVDDNRISVTAYPLVYDDGNNLVIDTDKMYCVYYASWYPKQRTNLLRRNK